MALAGPFVIRRCFVMARVYLNKWFPFVAPAYRGVQKGQSAVVSGAKGAWVGTEKAMVNAIEKATRKGLNALKDPTHARKFAVDSDDEDENPKHRMDAPRKKRLDEYSYCISETVEKAGICLGTLLYQGKSRRELEKDVIAPRGRRRPEDIPHSISSKSSPNKLSEDSLNSTTPAANFKSEKSGKPAMPGSQPPP